MQAQRALSNSRVFSSGYSNDFVSRSREGNGFASIRISSSSSSSTASPPPLSPQSPLSLYGDNFIEHHVSKTDTLAGVAIKYGVEVADIRRLNGLVTDIQMFAHKSLQIPLPGRHPPSPAMSNGSVHNSENTPTRESYHDILYSFQSLELKSSSKNGLTPEGTEMSVYKSRKPRLFKDEAFSKTPPSVPLHRKSQSLWNFITLEKDDITINIAESDKSIRRRQKADADSSRCASEILLIEECNGGVFPARGNGLALRPKPGSQGESCSQNSAFGGDSLLANVCVSIQKSSSTTNLIEFESSSALRPTSKWSLKADVVARPAKPAAFRRNYKAALD